MGCNYVMFMSHKEINQKEEYAIPLSEFEKFKELSILEVVVNYLKNAGLKLSEISILLKRDIRTIWTLKKRAQLKLESKIHELKGGAKK